MGRRGLLRGGDCLGWILRVLGRIWLRRGFSLWRRRFEDKDEEIFCDFLNRIF